MALFVRILGGSFPPWNCRYFNSLEQREIGYAMYEKEKQNIPTKAGKCNATLVPRNEFCNGVNCVCFWTSNRVGTYGNPRGAMATKSPTKAPT